MTKSNPSPAQDLLRVTTKVIAITKEAVHLHRQLVSITGSPSPDLEALQPLISREAKALQQTLLDVNQLLLPARLSQQPRYADKCLRHLRQQVQIYLEVTDPANATDDHAWIDANQTLATQLEGLLRDIELAEQELLPKLISMTKD